MKFYKITFFCVLLFFSTQICSAEVLKFEKQTESGLKIKFVMVGQSKSELQHLLILEDKNKQTKIIWKSAKLRKVENVYQAPVYNQFSHVESLILEDTRCSIILSNFVGIDWLYFEKINEEWIQRINYQLITLPFKNKIKSLRLNKYNQLEIEFTDNEINRIIFNEDYEIKKNGDKIDILQKDIKTFQLK